MPDECAGQNMFQDQERLKTLAYLVPDARAAFEKLIAEATSRGLLPTIVSAVRTCCEEKNLASAKGKGTRSWHILGRAVDIELHLGAPADDPALHYRELGEWWESLGGTWGGRWVTSWPTAPGVPGASGDVMHFQFTPPPLKDVPPQELWPTGADCTTIDANQTAYLGRDAVHGGAPSSPPAPVVVQPSSPSSPSSPASPPIKKKGRPPATQPPGLWFWCWGRLLSLRTSGHAVVGVSGEA
jgi:hypothetical protein